MKSKVIILLAVVLSSMIPHSGFAQSRARDSVALIALRAQLDSIRRRNANCPNCFADTTKENGYLIKENGKFLYSARHLGFGHWMLIYLPVLLYGFILFYLLAQLQQSKFSLADALSENYTVTISVPNPLAAPGDPPNVLKEVQPRSASRLIVFLSGLAALTIGVCATSYYFYIYLKTGTSPNLDNLFNILLGLGVGVVPYAFNRMSAAFRGTDNR